MELNKTRMSSSRLPSLAPSKGCKVEQDHFDMFIISFVSKYGYIGLGWGLIHVFSPLLNKIL